MDQNTAKLKDMIGYIGDLQSQVEIVWTRLTQETRALCQSHYQEITNKISDLRRSAEVDLHMTEEGQYTNPDLLCKGSEEIYALVIGLTQLPQLITKAEELSSYIQELVFEDNPVITRVDALRNRLIMIDSEIFGLRDALRLNPKKYHDEIIKTETMINGFRADHDVCVVVLNELTKLKLEYDGIVGVEEAVPDQAYQSILKDSRVSLALAIHNTELTLTQADFQGAKTQVGLAEKASAEFFRIWNEYKGRLHNMTLKAEGIQYDAEDVLIMIRENGMNSAERIISDELLRENRHRSANS